MKLHSAVGGKLGISGDEIDKLATLDRTDFDYGEWLVLRSARDFVDAGGRVREWDHAEDYRRLHAPAARSRHLKLFRMMRFANLLNNTVDGRPWRAAAPAFGDSCPVDAGRKGPA